MLCSLGFNTSINILHNSVIATDLSKRRCKWLVTEKKKTRVDLEKIVCKWKGLVTHIVEIHNATKVID